ncbi:MAG: Rrf2 family transcriptional regulator [Bacteroidales bacterium]|nr:Rrf2 family transcriptional regulator [Bacteroidales bacterium]
MRALVAISMENENGRRPSFREVAGLIDAPEQYVAKILQVFTKRGYLKSVRGRGGGFFFPEDKNDIRLFDIIVLMEGKNILTGVVLDLNIVMPIIRALCTTNTRK